MRHIISILLGVALLFHSSGELSAAPFTVSAVVTQPSCNNNDGNIAITTNPAPSYKILYKIYRNGVLLVQVRDLSTTLHSLEPGTYKIEAIDEATNESAISDNNVLTPSAQTLVATHTIDSPRCDTSKGRIIIQLNHYIKPINYVWSHSAFEQDDTAQDVPVGRYTVKITDSNNCRAYDTIDVKEYQGKMYVVQKDITPTSCDSPNGIIDIKIQGRFFHNPIYYPYNSSRPNFNSDTPDFIWVGAKPWDSFNMPYDSLAAGKYTVYFWDSLRCYPLIISDIEIKKNPPPKGIVIGTDSICPNVLGGYVKAIITAGDSTQLTYLWNTPNADVTDSVGNLAAGKYMVTIMDKAKCFDTPSKELFNYPERKIDIKAEKKQIVEGDETWIDLKSDSSLFYNLRWSPADKMRLGTNNRAWVFPKVETTYYLYANYGPGCETFDLETIKIVPASGALKDEDIPNMFSPNSDGKNNTYFIPPAKRPNDITSFEFAIYDRWGNRVFEAFDINFVWLGTDANGTVLSSGVYPYIMKYSTVSNKFDRIVKSGTILLEK